MYRRLLVFLRPHAWRMGATIGSSLMAAALDVLAFTLLIPFLNALFGVPALIPQGTGWITAVQEHTIGWMLRGRERMDALLMVIVAITVLVLIKNVFVWLQGQLGATLQEFVTRDLRDVVWRHLNRLPLRWFGRTKTGQIISRVLADTEQTKTLITQLVTQSIQNSAQILLTVIALVNLSWQLTLISLVIAPLLTLSLQPILRKLRKGHRTLRNEYGEMTSVLQEVVSGVRLVKSFGGEAYEERRFLDASGRYTRGMTRITRISFLSGPLTEVIGTSIAVLILWVGARQVLVTGTLSGSTLITFMILVMRLLPPLKSLSQTPTTAQQSLASAERFRDSAILRGSSHANTPGSRSSALLVRVTCCDQRCGGLPGLMHRTHALHDTHPLRFPRNRQAPARDRTPCSRARRAPPGSCSGRTTRSCLVVVRGDARTRCAIPRSPPRSPRTTD